jgi:hypothetical protein
MELKFNPKPKLQNIGEQSKHVHQPTSTRNKRTNQRAVEVWGETSV